MPWLTHRVKSPQAADGTSLGLDAMDTGCRLTTLLVMLIVLSGLPAVGKSSIAAALACRLKALHLRIDTIEQALRIADERRAEVGSNGYLVAYAVAGENLRHRLVVIADAVNGTELVREAWRVVAQRARASVVEVEVICSDPAEHERRAAARRSDIQGLRLPTWAEIRSRAYEPWLRRPLVVDTAKQTLPASVSQLADSISGRSC